MLMNLILALYCWINFEKMTLRKGDTINVVTENTDYEDLGEITFEDAGFMPILVMKSAWTQTSVYDPNIFKYF